MQKRLTMINKFLTLCLVLSLVCNVYFVMVICRYEQKITTKNNISTTTNIEYKKELPYVIDDGKGGLRRLTTDDFIK
jgi:hypothetical protein